MKLKCRIDYSLQHFKDDTAGSPAACSWTFRNTPVCTRAISWLLLEGNFYSTADVGCIFFFSDPLLICMGKGFTRGGRSELNRTGDITRDPLLICYSGQMWETKLCNKLNFYLLLCIVETEGGYFCWTLNWIGNCSDLQNKRSWRFWYTDIVKNLLLCISIIKYIKLWDQRAGMIKSTYLRK